MAGIIVPLVSMLNFLILARVISSWVVMAAPQLRRNSIVGPILNVIHQLTEPMLAPIRKLIPPMGGLDMSPLILWFLMSALLRIL